MCQALLLSDSDVVRILRGGANLGNWRGQDFDELSLQFYM